MSLLDTHRFKRVEFSTATPVRSDIPEQEMLDCLKNDLKPILKKATGMTCYNMIILSCSDKKTRAKHFSQGAYHSSSLVMKLESDEQIERLERVFEQIKADKEFAQVRRFELKDRCYDAPRQDAESYIKFVVSIIEA